MRKATLLIAAAAVLCAPAVRASGPDWLDWFAARVPAPAQTGPPRAPVPWLDWMADAIAFATAEAVHDRAADTAFEPVSGDPRAELQRVRRELQALQSDVRALQSSLDRFIEEVARPLHDENARLRAEIQRIHALHQADPAGIFPDVPRPGGDLVAEVISEAVERALEARTPRYQPERSREPEAGDVPLPGRAPAPEPAAAFDYAVISEWGRDPTDESVVLGEASSLKGMVIVVPENSRRRDIIELGRDLRARFDDYDNINIEVFDEPLAAQSFAESNVSTGPQHRVLSVSRHRASGRDTIVYLEGGTATEVDFE